MSEAHRDGKRKSDFSIARILGEEAINCGDCELSEGQKTQKSQKTQTEKSEVSDDFDEKKGISEDNEGISGEFNAQRNCSDLQWLQCTRYRPPRLPRNSSRSCKRRPATHPRIPFTTFQLEVLEDKYRSGPYLTRKDVLQLSAVLRLPQSRVKIWFQNRRARDRRENKVSSSLNIA